MALAHTIDSKVEAYRRGDLFAKRAALMKEWAKYCSGSPIGSSAEVLAGGYGEAGQLLAARDTKIVSV